MRFATALLFAATLCLSQQSFSQNKGKYKIYKPDFGPMLAIPNAKDTWDALTREGNKNGMTKELLLKKAAIVQPIVEKNPNWVDGYWMYANMMMIYGETQSSNDKKSMKTTRAYLVEARESSKKCLELAPNNMICKFFYGGALGKIATIDGIMSSLTKGKIILKHWQEVYASDQEFIFEDGMSLQGLVRYALGIYFRVVPDFILLDWLFDISGDIKKSVQMHRESLVFEGGDGPCSKLMLAVSLLCKSDGEANDPETKQAFNILDQIKITPKYNSQSAMVCVDDAPKLKKKPGDACGYTKAQVQKRDKKALEEQQIETSPP